MIYEKLSETIKIQQLQKFVTDQVLKYSPEMVSSHFGGWSVLSSNGNYRDGWSRGEQLYSKDFMPGHSEAERKKSLGIKDASEYIQPTEICTDYLKEIIDYIKALGLNPQRARLSLLKAGGRSLRHRDAPDEKYSVRLHIPIITNKDCLFCTDEESAHMPADGSIYLLHVNRMHWVQNLSSQDRIHLIMNVQDINHKSQFHQFRK